MIFDNVQSPREIDRQRHVEAMARNVPHDLEAMSAAELALTERYAALIREVLAR
jgi:hypothetical protein